MDLKPIAKEVDLRGQICPSTLLTALREVNLLREDIKSGKTSLVFFTDNRSSTTHIFETVSNMGYLVQVDKNQDYYKICVSRSY